MSQYRKKPVIIEARQLSLFNRSEIIDWINISGGTANEPDDDGSDVLFIETLEGKMVAMLRDWVIKGVQDEFYPCKPDIFEATYEPVVGEAELRP